MIKHPDYPIRHGVPAMDRCVCGGVRHWHAPAPHGCDDCPCEDFELDENWRPPMTDAISRKQVIEALEALRPKKRQRHSKNESLRILDSLINHVMDRVIMKVKSLPLVVADPALNDSKDLIVESECDNFINVTCAKCDGPVGHLVVADPEPTDLGVHTDMFYEGECYLCKIWFGTNTNRKPLPVHDKFVLDVGALPVLETKKETE